MENKRRIPRTAPRRVWTDGQIELSRGKTGARACCNVFKIIIEPREAWARPPWEGPSSQHPQVVWAHPLSSHRASPDQLFSLPPFSRLPSARPLSSLPSSPRALQPPASLHPPSSPPALAPRVSLPQASAAVAAHP